MHNLPLNSTILPTGEFGEMEGNKGNALGIKEKEFDFE